MLPPPVRFHRMSCFGVSLLCLCCRPDPSGDIAEGCDFLWSEAYIISGERFCHEGVPRGIGRRQWADAGTFRLSDPPSACQPVVAGVLPCGLRPHAVLSHLGCGPCSGQAHSGAEAPSLCAALSCVVRRLQAAASSFSVRTFHA